MKAHVSTITRIVAVLAAFAAALFLASCGGKSHDDHATSAEDKPLISGEPAAFNDDDVSFANGMIMHHRQAIEMATLAPTHSTNEQLITLAGQIQAAQQPEIQMFSALLGQWGAEMNHADHAGMPGMVDDATMARLQSLNGTEFDTLWLQSMIAHHQGAIDMSRTELEKGTNVDAKQTAGTIISEQQAEIDQMNQMLAAGG